MPVEGFIGAGEARVQALETALRDAEGAVRELRVFYGEPGGGSDGAEESGDSCPSQSFFALVSQLAAAVKRAVTELNQVAEQVSGHTMSCHVAS